MTGFGKGTASSGGKKLTVEIRSLNSKQLDLNMRLPFQYREKEAEIRSLISKNAERGKVDFSIYFESVDQAEPGTINKTLARAYYQELYNLSTELGATTSDLFSLTLKMPDVLKAERAEVEEQEWEGLRAALDEALINFNQFRSQEGEVLKKELSGRINSIASLLNQVAALDQERIPAVREKLMKNISEVISRETLDNNRFEQEVIYYIEKLDITEEKVRLNAHLEYFLKTMEEESAGRKLGFITQEIGREINTIGSKANDAGIQKLVVLKKDELEKIKEQLLNVL